MAVLTEEMAVTAVNEVLANKRNRVDALGPDSPLADLGLDSLEVAELFAALEEHSGLELDPDSAGELVTVRDLVKLRAV